MTNIVALSGGDGFSLALKADGTVWAWGNNLLGQIGDGTFLNRNQPKQVSGPSKVSAISGGGTQTLALKPA